MPSSRERDENGFLVVKGCPISSFGIFDYGAGQVGLPGDPNRIVKVYRPESAVSDPEAIESFKNVPLINDHTVLSGFEGDDGAAAPEDKGVDGILTGNVYYEAPWMKGDIKVFSREMQELLNSGKKDLSLGYSCTLTVQSGTFEGQAYEVIQTNMRGNHIALVDEGRVPGARVLDGLCFDHLRFDVVPSDKEATMKLKAKGKRTAAMDSAVEQLKALLPALEQYLNEEAQEPQHVEGGEVAAEATPQDAEVPAEVPAEGAEAQAEEGQDDLGSLIAEVKGVLAKLEAAMGSKATDEEGTNASSEEGAVEGQDAVEGLNTGEQEPALADGESANGQASSGPVAGKNEMANDSALRRFYADSAAKDRLYDRLSKVVGAFDCKAMDARQVAVYGAGKLNLACAKGQEHIALDAYLTGVEAANKFKKTTVQARTADAAYGASSELDEYLKGTK